MEVMMGVGFIFTVQVSIFYRMKGCAFTKKLVVGTAIESTDVEAGCFGSALGWLSMKILTSPQLRCGEEGIIYNKNYIPREYIGDHPVPSYACLPTLVFIVWTLLVRAQHNTNTLFDTLYPPQLRYWFIVLAVIRWGRVGVRAQALKRSNNKNELLCIPRYLWAQIQLDFFETIVQHYTSQHKRLQCSFPEYFGPIRIYCSLKLSTCEYFRTVKVRSTHMIFACLSKQPGPTLVATSTKNPSKNWFNHTGILASIARRWC